MVRRKDHPGIYGRIVTSWKSSKIQIFSMRAMGQVAVLDPASTVRVMAVAVLTLDSKEMKVITATRVVTTRIIIKGASNNNSLVTRATRSS